KLAVASQSVLEDLHVPRAVHRLDGVDPVIRGLREIHVLTEGCRVTRLLPERGVHELRGVDFLIARRLLPLAHVADEALEDDPSLRMPKDCSGCLLLQVKEVELLADA